MKSKLLLLSLVLLLQSCGNWATVTGEKAREAIDLHETDRAALPEKVIYKTIEEDQQTTEKKSD